MTAILKLFTVLACVMASVSALQEDKKNISTGGNLRRRLDSNCFTGGSTAITQWCTNNNMDCCQGQNACNWTGSRTICSGSCNGQAACLHGQVETIESDSCNGLGACQDVQASGVIGSNSCNGQGACFKFNGNDIADDSCNNFQACHDAHILLASGCNEFAECDGLNAPPPSFTEVTELCDGRCCVGDGACQWTWTKTVGLGSCMGTLACENSGATTIGSNSCVGTAACRGNRVDGIGNDSCNDYAACFNIKAQQVGDDTCNGWQSCHTTDARNVALLTGCNGTGECEGQVIGN